MSRAGVLGARAASVVRGQAPASTQAFHCSTVTSVLPIANGASMVTRCGGFSLGSLLLLPMVNTPCGTLTSTGQAGQSRMSAPLFGTVAGLAGARAGCSIGDAAAGAGGVSGAGF